MSRAWVAVFVGAIVAWAGSAGARRPLPPFEHAVSSRHAPQDLGAVLLGARKVGASLAFIQLLQYYGGPSDRAEDGRGFPRLLNYGDRMLSIFPTYHYGVLYTAGFLAFNNPINRPGEALALLARAREKDPKFYRYGMLAAAIGYTEDERSEESVKILDEFVRDPECPSMIKHILANIHRKAGRYDRAAQIYAELLDARDTDYAARAEKNLLEMVSLGQVRKEWAR